MTPVCSLSDRFRVFRIAPCFGALFSLCLVPRLVWGQEPSTEPPPTVETATQPVPAAEPVPAAAAPEAAPPDAEKRKGKRHKKRERDADAAIATEAPQPAAAEEKADKPNKHDLRLKGRVFALAELSHRRETVVDVDAGLVTRDRDALDLSLQSARFGVEYRAPLRWLSAEVELEVAGKVRAKDAFVQAGRTAFVKAGQFKVPSAALELDSPWTLPLVRRGLVHDLMTDWMDIAGRAPGVAVGYRSKGGLEPRVILGVFQGSTLKQVVGSDRDVKLIDHASLEAQTYAARAQISPFGVALGAWYEQRVSSMAVAQFRHFATFGLDATVSQRLGPGVLRAWVDGSGGQSSYVAASKSGSADTPWFVTGRALAAYRFGGLERDDVYVEPFGFFSALDPDTEVVSDLVSEGALGVSAGFWDRARITLQGEISNGKRNFPKDFLGGTTPDHRSLLLQAGARF